MKQIKIKVEPRKIKGKKVKNLRKSGRIPVSLYGPKFPAQDYSVESKEFQVAFAESGFSSLLDTELADGKEKLLVKEVQKNPVTDEIFHVSFYVVDRNTEITAEIPLELVGKSPAEDTGVGFVVQGLNTLTVRCLPANLVSQIELSVAELSEVGDSITVSDLKLPKGLELDSSVDATTSIVYVSGMQKEEVEEVEEAEPVAGEESEAKTAGTESGETADAQEGE